ncbi:MAG: adenosylcobinamide-GDP ribazoletransferase [Nitrospirota bacterium]
MKQLLLAFQFLTIIPTQVRGEVSERDIAQSAAFFPAVGAFQGMVISLSAALFLKLFSPEIAGGLLLLLLTLSNGGFHIDGLADTFDALAVKSRGDRELDREKRLAVMKDSTTGAIGVVAILITILLKYLFIHNLLITASIFTAYSALFLMPVFSKWIMIPAMYHGTSARQNGLGRIFLNGVKGNTVIFSSLLVALCYIAVAELHLLKMYGPDSIVLFLILFAALYALSVLAVRFCEQRFGGLTGDNLGALSEVSEIIFLAIITLWLQHFI